MTTAGYSKSNWHRQNTANLKLHFKFTAQNTAMSRNPGEKGGQAISVFK
ncbi:hypothetical protein HMPREF0262_00985 [Clostridium sp. ATCC 29733]|nr:hypothetical protein HMPREF0262_00985 [Clostridium sp. ATCC 29733]